MLIENSENYLAEINTSTIHLETAGASSQSSGRGVTSVLPASCLEIGYLMERIEGRAGRRSSHSVDDTQQLKPLFYVCILKIALQQMTITPVFKARSSSVYSIRIRVGLDGDRRGRGAAQTAKRREGSMTSQ
ncbi:hypothetical protein EVAR_45101_1 [Eumeta japonica]|uniref:Uncharacterized protein n=1 Tax=Eumeta variegata TaxID=151549 RepID=A0A4C1YIY5_EUMVA|nr:hypothetical protein EVAR_45101_1 [Eumeta japonica]